MPDFLTLVWVPLTALSAILFLKWRLNPVSNRLYRVFVRVVLTVLPSSAPRNTYRRRPLVADSLVYWGI